MKKQSENGFSLIEVVVAMGLAVVVMAMVFGFFVNTSKSFKSEQSGVDMQQAARVAVDELGRMLQQTGYGIWRPDAYNAGEWQRSVVYAGAHAIAVNADIDSSLGPIDKNQTLTFPTGDTYNGEGLSNRTVGAETYVYSLDANADNVVTLDDRSEVESGSFNPAVATENPLDFALFRRVYGYDGTNYSTTSAPIIPYLFTAPVDGITYADGTIPEPLFTYVLTEDLNGNEVLEDSECVNDDVDTCPPSSSRPPLLYLWGDTDFNGSLSDAETDALRTIPVGSPNWSKNRLVASGVYKATKTSAAIDPTDPFAYVLEVADASQLAVGAMIAIGTGTVAEQAIVESIVTTTTPNQVVLTAIPDRVHSSGIPIQIVPDTLLRAIRAVQINFTSISARKDAGSHGAPAGQTGRATTHGMDYRTLTLQRTVELMNTGTVALRAKTAGSGTGNLACPLKITSECGGSTVSGVSGFVGGNVPIYFVVTDNDGNTVGGVDVAFSRTGTAGGAFSSDVVKTDDYGVAQADFIPTGGSLGSDTVQAEVMCDSVAYTDSIDVSIHDIQLAVSQNCMSTVSSRTTNPGTAFVATVMDENGVMPGTSVDLRLRVDGDTLSPADDFSNIQADLYEAGSYVGSTNSLGWISPHTTATDGNGLVLGTMQLVADNSDGGTRIDVIASTTTTECVIYGGDAVQTVSFYNLELDSTAPISGCVVGAPCTIAPGSPAPEAMARLSIAGQPVPDATLEFSAADTHGDPDIPPAESILDPGSTFTSDNSGEATVMITNNGSASITSGNPLQTAIDVTTTGELNRCSSGVVNAIDSQLGFQFEGDAEASSCSLDIQQSWVELDGNRKKVCMSIQNLGEVDGCPQSITGVKFALFEANGVDLEPNNAIKLIEGAKITSEPKCDKDVDLFKEDCLDPKAYLQNDQRWDFFEDKCKLPKENVGPGEYFSLNKIEWVEELISGRDLVVTVYYDCTGACTGDTGLEATFRLTVP